MDSLIRFSELYLISWELIIYVGNSSKKINGSSPFLSHAFFHLFLVSSHYVSDFKEIKSIIFFLQPRVMVLQVLTGLFPLLQ